MMLLTFPKKTRKPTKAAKTPTPGATTEQNHRASIEDAMVRAADAADAPSLEHGTAATYATLTDAETAVLAYLLSKLCSCGECLSTLLRTAIAHAQPRDGRAAVSPSAVEAVAIFLESRGAQ